MFTDCGWWEKNRLRVAENKHWDRIDCRYCSGLEELILSANQAITHAGWTELFFSISFNSRLRRMAVDYNILDNTTVAMLSMIVASR